MIVEFVMGAVVFALGAIFGASVNQQAMKRVLETGREEDL